jgi:hypothetical protein
MNRKHNTEHDALREAALSRGEKTYYGPACKHGHDGRRFTVNRCCVKCAGARAKARYQSKTPEQKQQYCAEQYARPKDPRYALLHAAKHRALKFKRDFDLTLDDIVIPEVCPVLGIPMDSPSLDRKENHLGYTKGNTRVISLRANKLKNDSTIEELEKILDYMRASH